MTFVNPQYLVETDWLETHLADPDLRVLDCTVFFDTDAHGFYLANGRDAWAQGHIPGSGFADLMSELADQESPLPFMLPPATQFAEAMSQYGVGDGTRVVLYEASRDRWANMWAARLWWMLQAFGFDQAAVLNGGWHKWTMEGRPISTQPCHYPPARFSARPRPGLMADKRDVLAAIGDSGSCLINALTVEDYAGTTAYYGRPGHIPSSVSVPAVSLVDPVTHAYLPAEQLRAQFAAVGALNRRRVITYCGGAIAASSDAFVLTLLGVTSVAVYDGSLLEWAADPTLPMELAGGAGHGSGPAAS
ncbi:MAG TPA: sulfurtransferase [Candidatus Tectomicrobia bacterium]|jgi:thiosulfate/3-mercaptopyruvate sulfurtransferase